MISSDDLLLICRLSREKSLASVARTINLSPSAVSQRLSALERKLDIRIAERVGRSGVFMTSEGEFLATQGARLLDDLRHLDEQLDQRKGKVRGQLKIVAPFGFGRHYIAPAIADFQSSYPEVSVDLSLSDDVMRLPVKAWDIIVRVGSLRGSSLTLTQLAPNRRILCASKGYLDEFGTPSHPDDLKHHQCLVICEDSEDAALWEFQSSAGDKRRVRVIPSLSTNDGEVALSWALAGRGIVLRSEWHAALHIRAGSLRQVLPGWGAGNAPIIALTQSAERRSRLVKVMLEYLGSTIGTRLDQGG